MWLPLLFLIVIYNLCNVEGQVQLFIGQGSTSLYFAIRTPYEWDWGLNYCHTLRLMIASIETEEDHQLVTNFLNSSTDLSDEYRFLWLPATYHRREGKFQWTWNREEVNVGSWAPGMPSTKRTANCLAINRYGHFIEEACQNSGRSYYSLSAAQNFFHGRREGADIKANHNGFNHAKLSNHETIIDNRLIDDKQQRALLQPIGQVGSRMYFADDQEISWTESLDLCHSAGMQLANQSSPIN